MANFAIFAPFHYTDIIGRSADISVSVVHYLKSITFAFCSASVQCRVGRNEKKILAVEIPIYYLVKILSQTGIYYWIGWFLVIFAKRKRVFLNLALQKCLHKTLHLSLTIQGQNFTWNWCLTSQKVAKNGYFQPHDRFRNFRTHFSRNFFCKTISCISRNFAKCTTLVFTILKWYFSHIKILREMKANCRFDGLSKFVIRSYKIWLNY